MRLSLSVRFVAMVFSCFCFLAAGSTAWASSGPDNKYCQAGNHPTFGDHDGPATLPQACVYTAESATPSPGKTISVNAGGDLQGAFDSAQCGDIISIQADAVFVGNFHLNSNKCDSDHWVTIRTAAPDSSLPPEGTRLTPCYAGVASLPGRPDYPCTAPKRVIPQIASPKVSPAISLRDGASHYRLIGLEITRNAGTGFIGPLIGVEKDYQANNIIIDRAWVHGSTHDDTASAAGFDGMTFAAVIDSYLSDFHCTWKTGACTDAHAIAAGVSAQPGGPYKIVNNYLEASGENIMMGGGHATATPADIEIRRNHMFKPLIWMKGQSGFVGGNDGNPFAVLNLSELKNAQRVLFEGNVMENSWGGFTQNGAVILLTPKSQYNKSKHAGVCPDCQVTDITVRYSKSSHSGRGIAIAAGLTGEPKGTYQAKAAARYSLHDITMDDIDAKKYDGGGGLFQIYNTWPKNGLNSILIEHVTAFGDPSSSMLLITDPTNLPKIPNVGFTNNLLLAGRYPIWNDGGSKPCADSVYPKNNLDNCFASYAFTTNGIIGTPEQYGPSKWPAKNMFPANPAAVQFVNYNNGNGGDYHLLSSSPYKDAGSDGKDLGADIDAIIDDTDGVQ
jgi:hypothetical protein